MICASVPVSRSRAGGDDAGHRVSLKPSTEVRFRIVKRGMRAACANSTRLQVDLVDPVRRLGRRPPRIGPAGRGVAVAPAGNRDARQFDAGRGGADRTQSLGKSAGKSGVAQLLARGRGGGRSPSSAPRRDCTSRSAARRRSVFPRRHPMPRVARSIASVSPTGPAPTTRTFAELVATSLLIAGMSLCCLDVHA